jgi:futalosine hydrolase
MRIVIFAATALELNGLLTKKDKPTLIHPFPVYRKVVGQHAVDIIITGIGLVAGAYAASKTKLNDYELIINAGIAGSFDKQIQIGDCVVIKEERLIELGAEDHTNWIRPKDMKLEAPDTFNLKYNLLPTKVKQLLKGLKQVKALSANTAHGNTISIKKIQARYPAQIESMEGAAIAFATNKMDYALLQIRCISNYVEKRDKSKWNIPLAITNLNTCLLQLIHQI